MKLGQNMDLGPVIARILGPLVLGRTSYYIERTPGDREVYTAKKWETVRLLAPKDKNNEKSETCVFRRQSTLFYFRQLSLTRLAKLVRHPTT